MSSEINRIIRDLSIGNFVLTIHAEKRMSERRVRYEDIRYCARSVERVEDRGDGKYQIFGSDFDGDELSIVAAWDC